MLALTVKIQMMNKILVSACFLGERVRYNAEIKTLLHPLLKRWQKQGRLVTLCPEVAGGLPTPRPPAEIQQIAIQHSKKQGNVKAGEVITMNGSNVTQAFVAGAQRALEVCQRQQIQFALLKESSPSCGSAQIYDGTFSGKKMAGQGITTQLLQQHGIQVFSEKTIEALALLLD